MTKRNDDDAARLHPAGRRRSGRRRGAIAAGPGRAATRQAPSMAKGRVIGANDRINVGFVGCGGRMNTHIRRVMERNKERGDVQAVAVNDIWDKRKERAREATGVDERSVYHDYRERLRPARRRRRGHRVARPLAPPAGDGGAAQRQGRLPREADDLHGRRGEGDRRRRQGQRPRAAGRQPVHVDGSLLEGARRRSPTACSARSCGRRAGSGATATSAASGTTRSIPKPPRRRSTGRPSSARRRSGRSTRSDTSAGGNTGTTPAASPPTCSTTRSRRCCSPIGGEFPAARHRLGRHLHAEGPRGPRHVLHERRLPGLDDAAGVLGGEAASVRRWWSTAARPRSSSVRTART